MVFLQGDSAITVEMILMQGGKLIRNGSLAGNKGQKKWFYNAGEIAFINSLFARRKV